MDKLSFNILDYVNEGIIITNENLEILFWNNCLVDITGKSKEVVLNKNILNVIPRFNKEYFRSSIKSTIEHGHKFFFSAAMHNDIISKNTKVNLRLSRLISDDKKYLIIECTDVTNQITRVNQLKKTNEELKILNNKLKEKEKQIKKLAYYDKLTGLANRTFFYNVADKILEDSKRKLKKMGIMFIDIDKFKSINDKYGHKTGDRVLVEVARLLNENTRKLDIVSRHGGDEFLILLPDIKDYENYKQIASRIEQANKEIYIDDQISIKISLSIGVSFYPKDGDNIDQLISRADKAMYYVKNKGGNKCIRY